MTPRTEAGRLLDWAHDPQTTLGQHGFWNIKSLRPAILAVEAEAARIDPERLARAIWTATKSDDETTWEKAREQRRIGCEENAAAIAAAYGAEP